MPDADGVLAAKSSSRSTSCSNDGDGGPVTDGEFDAELEKPDGTISDWNVAEDRFVA